MRDTKDCWLKDHCKQMHCNDEKGCMILFKLDYLYDEACVSDKQRAYIQLRTDDDGTDLDEFKILKHIQDTIEEFVQDGRQLYIHSQNCGCGKTAWSLRLLQTYFKRIWLNSELKCRGLFISVPQFLLAMKANITTPNDYYKHIEQEVLNADLIIFDDLGTKAASSFEAEKLFSIIDQRINAGKANIFNANLTNTELHAALGDRLASRIISDIELELHGGDKRRLVNNEEGK